ncbi:MAG TPA: hypothetical protein VJ932_03205, partial [Alkalispirochaeta sp.]|nr:hypothetical protein [Alkalispirochaeta sp.]
MGITIGSRQLAILSLAVLVLSATAVDTVGAQSFRGEVSSRDTITPGATIERTISSGDVLLVHVDPAGRRFIAGLEITVETASESITPGSFSAAVFGAVDPPDARGVQNLAGQRLQTLPLTDPRRHQLYVPFGVDNSSDLQDNATRPVDPGIGDIAIQLVPIMKGMDSAALSAAYSVRIVPRLRPIGAVRVVLAGEESLLSQTRAELQLTLGGD